MGELVMEALATRRPKVAPIRSASVYRNSEKQGFSEFVGQITVDDD